MSDEPDQNWQRRRRFPTPPIVPLSQGVSPPALLNRLGLLAAEIGGSRPTSSTPTFFIQKRRCRDAVRLAALLTVFLEEIKGGDANLVDSAAVVDDLADLYLAFQKLRKLLHECGRRGGRMWMLMRCERTAEEFRTTLRSVERTVDLLIMAMDGGLSPEGEEYGRMAARVAAAGSAGEAETADKAMTGDVGRVIGAFEMAEHPDKETMKSVFDYLEIRTWGDCDEEVAFLEEEIGSYVNTSAGEGDVSLCRLCSLYALMVYARSVVFTTMADAVDHDGRSRDGGSAGNVELGCVEEFRCPISLTLMKDPVIVPTGQSYERAAILHWFKSGNRTCPATGKLLETTQLTPNLALRNVIQYYKHSVSGSGSSSPSSSSSSSSSSAAAVSEHQKKVEKAVAVHLPGSMAAAEATKLLAEVLVAGLSDRSGEEQRIKALQETRMVSKMSSFHRLCLIEAGCIPWLLHFCASWEAPTQENSIAAIVNLVKHTKARKVVFDAGGLFHVVDVLTDGRNQTSRQLAAVVLFYLSSVEDYRKAIGEASSAVPALVKMLRSETTRGKMTAMTTLFALLLSSENHKKVLDTGAVGYLVDILATGKEELAGDSLSILYSLAEKLEGAEAILRLPGSVPAMVETLRSSPSLPAKKQCVSLLYALLSNGDGEGGKKKVSIDLKRFPHLMPSLYALLAVADGSPKAHQKTSLLIRILLAGGGHPPSGSPDSKALQHHEVHVR